MRLRDKVVVPELSPSTQARVEARFVAAVRDGEGRESPMASLFGGLRAVALGVAVAGVIVAIAFNLDRVIDSSAVVGSSVARATVTEISTGSDSVTLRVGDASVTVGPETAVTFMRQPGGLTSLALERGRVDCNVEPIAERAPFLVGAADVDVRVVGTVFSVEHDPTAAADLAVRVAVTRGKVAVSSPSGEVMVAAGRAWNARDGVGALVAAADPSIDETTATDAVEETTTSPAAGATKTPRRPHDTQRGPKRTAKHVKAASKPKSEKLPRPRRMTVPSRADGVLDDAMALEKDDPREAIRIYTRIASKNHRDLASFALYSRAYVEYVRLGDRASALRTLDLFRRRFPRARESESALWLQIKSLCELERQTACRSAAHSYMRRYPDGRFAAAAKQIVDNLGD